MPQRVICTALTLHARLRGNQLVQVLHLLSNANIFCTLHSPFLLPRHAEAATMFTSLNPPRNTLAAPSSFFALDFVLPDTERPSRDDPQITDSLAGPGTGLLVHENMTSRHLYSCFDTLGKGHFQSADELCDNGVWIGYLAEESYVSLPLIKRRFRYDMHGPSTCLPFCRV